MNGLLETSTTAMGDKLGPEASVISIIVVIIIITIIIITSTTVTKGQAGSGVKCQVCTSQLVSPDVLQNCEVIVAQVE